MPFQYSMINEIVEQCRLYIDKCRILYYNEANDNKAINYIINLKLFLIGESNYSK